ncbi:YciI family protein [Vreelandella profundi]|uniref:YciI family protein n=1 Tax=Vreelandella profundi TaxID=2852117 RepID=UPI001EEFF543|nr:MULTISPECIES: YciI family protein [Halomonas]MDN7132147.1 YciI family protein [Halomonas sp. MC140]
MPFLIETFDKPDHQVLRLEVRQAHLEYLDANVTLLLACGAKLSDDGTTASGGLYLVDLDSREEAERFIQADPFHEAELFAEVNIVRWRQAYLNRQNTL